MTAPFRALGLAPVAVLPGRQGESIGSALIRDGLARATAAGWEGVFVLGEPEYYRRFGFNPAMAKEFSSPYAGPYLMALSLDGKALPVTSGPIDYARSEEHTSELQSLMRISYAVFCLKKKKTNSNI